MMIKYLEEIGVKGDSVVDSKLFPEEDDKRREKRFKEQRDEYGFDERETWDLRYTSACWLYQHIKMYKDIGAQVVDTSFYKFKYSDEEGNEYELTQGESIDRILELLEKFIKHENKDGVSEDYVNEDMEAQAALCDAFKIYSTIIPAMWW